MKTIAILIVAGFLAGCASPRSSPDSTELPLGIGRYQIMLPHIAGIVGSSNNPTMSVYECGRLCVETIPLGNTTRTETWVDWLGGEIQTSVYTRKGAFLGRFSMWSDGTNTYLSVNDSAYRERQYIFEPDTNGTYRLRDLKD